VEGIAELERPGLGGIVTQTGPGVTSFSAGDEVIGWTDNRASQAQYVLVEEQHLTAKPAGVPWQEAGALFVAGTTAQALPGAFAAVLDCRPARHLGAAPWRPSGRSCAASSSSDTRARPG
jgi:NADPH:quinone reductase-like Zn-dependent oxidoreductase